MAGEGLKKIWPEKFYERVEPGIALGGAREEARHAACVSPVAVLSVLAVLAVLCHACTVSTRLGVVRLQFLAGNPSRP